MPITTDRHDVFDRLATVLRHLPGARRVEERLGRKPAWRRVAWFATIYLVSVVVFAAVAFFLNAIVPK